MRHFHILVDFALVEVKLECSDDWQGSGDVSEGLQLSRLGGRRWIVRSARVCLRRCVHVRYPGAVTSGSLQQWTSDGRRSRLAYDWTFMVSRWVRVVSPTVVPYTLPWRFYSIILDRRHRVTIFTEAELTFTFTICRRASVCRLSVVCNVRAPYSGYWYFRQCFYDIWYLGHLWPFDTIFTEIVTKEFLRRGVKPKRVAKYSDFGHFQGYISETV